MAPPFPEIQQPGYTLLHRIAIPGLDEQAARPMDVPADCLRCGACCFSPAPHYVRVTGADWTRLGPDAERLAHFAGRGNEAFMRMRDGHCAALDVRPGGEFFCTVYACRPQTCRDLGRGSPECRGELMMKKGGAACPQADFNSPAP